MRWDEPVHKMLNLEGQDEHPLYRVWLWLNDLCKEKENQTPCRTIKDCRCTKPIRNEQFNQETKLVSIPDHIAEAYSDRLSLILNLNTNDETVLFANFIVTYEELTRDSE